MRNNGTLIVGQTIRYQESLWRVDFVNSSRARIVPLKKRHVVLKHDDGSEKRAFDAEYGGVNISPTSCVPIIPMEDVADELQALKEAAPTPAPKAAPASAPAPTSPTPAASKAGRPAAKAAPTPAAKGGWHRTSKASAFKAGSLANMVISYIETHPGLETKKIVPAFPADFGNIASCISRFMQAGLIEKK